MAVKNLERYPLSDYETLRKPEDCKRQIVQYAQEAISLGVYAYQRVNGGTHLRLPGYKYPLLHEIINGKSAQPVFPVLHGSPV